MNNIIGFNKSVERVKKGLVKKKIEEDLKKSGRTFTNKMEEKIKNDVNKELEKKLFNKVIYYFFFLFYTKNYRKKS